MSAQLQHDRRRHRRLPGTLGQRLCAALAAALTLASAPAMAQPAEPAAVALPAAPTAPTADAGKGTAVIGLGIGGYASGQRTTAFAVDSQGGRSSSDPTLSSRLRAHLDARVASPGDRWVLDAALGFDVVDGTVLGRTLATLGDKLPDQRLETMIPQDAWIGVHYGKTVGIKAGLMTSHWGMGLVANDGGAGRTVDRNDWFSLGRSGDRVARVQVYAMPFAEDKDSPLRGWLVSASADSVIDDDTLTGANQKANQYSFATKLYLDKQRWAGFYGAYRDQHQDDGKTLKVGVLDGALDFDYRDAARNGMRLEAECAWITGDTTLSPTPDHPTHDIAQLGAMGRLSWAGVMPGMTLQLDGGYFSGDDNLDDGKLTAFHADRNVRQGLVLFERVLAWQTGRSRLQASNPNLVGKPAEDLDRLASDGSIFNAATIFPKIGYRVTDHIEIYGGALFAFSPSRVYDPYNTRVYGGGYPRNYLNGDSGNSRVLGTEFDVGVRGQMHLPGPWRSMVQLALEYGVLLPGAAIQGPDGNSDPVQATRLTLSLLGR